jgi:hypothetical protein
VQLAQKIRSPADQFRQAVLANMACLLAQLPTESRFQLLGAMPMLAAYQNAAITDWRAADSASAADWSAATIQLVSAEPDWPLGRILGSGFTALHLHLLLTLLMVEEDRELAEFVEPDAGLPTLGGLIALWRMHNGNDDPIAVREALADLSDAGFAEVIADGAMRNDQRYRVPAPLAETMAGLRPHMTGLILCPPLPRANGWIAPQSGCAHPDSVAAAVTSGSTRSLVIRGPRRNGRKHFARRVAQTAGLGAVEVSADIAADPVQWLMASNIAYLSNAMLLCEIEPGPGETVVMQERGWADPFVAVATGLAGAVATGRNGATLTITLPLPDVSARQALWKAAGLRGLAKQVSVLVLPSGNIDRAAQGAMAQAALAGRGTANIADVQAALRTLRDARLDAIATRIDIDRAPDAIFLDKDTQGEFEALVARCRQRELLSESNIGVRALLSGPSGTGKTLAARHVAQALGKDLYRVDLSATVNKYIGETEKALERVLSAAEELDIILLLDEGDALMAKRTDVGSSNDRYANLETNFLLQRIESFNGLILVTSNDAERIDSAFARRMDAVLEFAAPDEVLRLDILKRQLGDTERVGEQLLEEIACRCALTGGQLRNVALHARLLALDVGIGISDAHLRCAVEREYKKTNTPCPLRRTLAAVG